TDLNYTKGSVYEKNINLLFDKFTSTSSSLRFDNFTVGDASDQVYGIFQCRFDVSLDVCNACIKNASEKIVEECPLLDEAIVWYYECMLRYANRNIFNLTEASPAMHRCSPSNVTNYGEFAPVLAQAMNEVIETAAYTPAHYASNESTYSLFTQLFSFAQCTPDINNTGCKKCLKSTLWVLATYCNASDWAMVFDNSCQMRYDGFYPILTQNQTRPSPPSPPPSNNNEGLRPASPSSTKTSLKPAIIGAIAASVSVGLLVLSVVLWICVCRKRDVPPFAKIGHNHGVEGLGEAELVQYDFATMKIATGDFSAENTLGKGGFGYVYKGTLKNGDQLAIKRLSSTSGQGTEEFLAEARFLAKLQHNNVVKLVGFCLEGEEKLLGYDFMSNSSLEGFLFDPVKQRLLDWKTRSRIITGIAKGLQYLHEDSRLTIIHRDIKPENILLDKEMNPKIADFGLAKRTGVEEKYGITGVIKGTQGYMAPECVNGEFSNKSDIYSFGVMLLEIVSGQQNRKYYQANEKSLQSHACNLWNEGRPFDFRDATLGDDCSRKDVIRCIQIGLLCLQTDPEKRPEISLIVSQLTSSGSLPSPSSLGLSAHQLIVPINDDGQSTGSDTVSLTMQLNMTQDLYPKAR
ncbi:hypothetical protein KSS87_013336, partial [Heliosperma pusillum]